MSQPQLKLSIITPVFNESESIFDFLKSVDLLSLSTLSQIDLELIVVNDGSSDETTLIIEKYKTNSKLTIRVISLSRNFGHQGAVWAGLEQAEPSRFVVVIDSDLQDPITEIPNILNAFREGFDVVLMQRLSRKDSFAKKITASLYYRLVAKLSGNSLERDVGDFFGLSPKAREATLKHGEVVKYLRGIIQQIGYKRIVLKYDRHPRLKGNTKYTIAKMLSLGVSGLTGFSIQPLVLSMFFSLLGVALSLFLLCYVILLNLLGKLLPSGWSFLIVSAATLGIITLFNQAIQSLYIARLVQEAKKRPVYLIDGSPRSVETVE